MLDCRPCIINRYHRAINHLRLIRSQESNATRNIISTYVWNRCALAVLGYVQLHDRAAKVSQGYQLLKKHLQERVKAGGIKMLHLYRTRNVRSHTSG